MELEDINKSIQGSVTDKVSMHAKIKAALKHVDQVFSNNLSKTEHIALSDKVNEAKEILKHLK